MRESNNIWIVTGILFGLCLSCLAVPLIGWAPYRVSAIESRVTALEKTAANLSALVTTNERRQMPQVQIEDGEFRPLTEEEYAAKVKVGELIRQMDKKESIIKEVGRVARHGWSEKQKAVPPGTCRICGKKGCVDLSEFYCDGCYREASMRNVRSDEMLQGRSAE